MTEDILYKQTSSPIEDYDEKLGVVKAYANVYGNEDSDRDISVYGSFKRTVNNNRKRMRVLKDHISTMMLGVPLDIDAEDTYGLGTTTQFNLKKELSRDMLSDIELLVANDMSAELSIGYFPMKRDPEDQRKIVEYKLFEYSFLTAQASNPLALVTDIKKLKNSAGVIDLLTKMYNLQASDTRLKQIEFILKSLALDDPEEISTHANDPIFTTKNFVTLEKIFEKCQMK